jgi:Sec-independent protein secretion pathway component TatC
MQKAITVIIILIASFVLAFIFSPPDPISFEMIWTGILAVGILSYVVGWKQGKMHAEKRSKVETQTSAENN